MRKSKTQWNQDEETIILKRAAEYFRDHRTAEPIEAIRFGQGQLPADRRRNLDAPSIRYSPRINRMIDLLRERAIPWERTSASAGKVVTSAAPPPPAETTSIDASLVALSEAIADGIARRLRAALRARVSEVTAAAAKGALETRERMRLRRVAVVGPLSGQGTMLQEEFKGLLDLRILDKEGNPAGLLPAMTNADSVVLWANFISHSIQEISPKEKTFLVSGGMDALRAKLEEIYCA